MQNKEEMLKYAAMSKAFMNSFPNPGAIVGNFQWHENFPYEQSLFYRDAATKVLKLDGTELALDFGCGPGRMIKRLSPLFARIDGVDISSTSIKFAKELGLNSQFYESSGIDLGDAPNETYDFVYSTIAVQHIPSLSIRMNIFGDMWRVLKPGAKICIQMAYHPTFAPERGHAPYERDDFNANATNGDHDVVINEKDLPLLKQDFEAIGFKDVHFVFANVDRHYSNLGGAYHGPYWAQDWIFIHGTK